MGNTTTLLRATAAQRVKETLAQKSLVPMNTFLRSAAAPGRSSLVHRSIDRPRPCVAGGRDLDSGLVECRSRREASPFVDRFTPHALGKAA